MSLKYQITLFTLIICPIALITFYFVAMYTSPSSCTTDSPSSNETEIDESSIECHVNGWSKWSSCSCVEDNVMFRTRTVDSNYEREVHSIDPCADIDTIQYITCPESDCYNSEHCREPLSEEIKTLQCDDAKYNITFWSFELSSHSCIRFEIKNCLDIYEIKNKFPTRKQCEKSCFFQNYDTEALLD